MALASFRLFAFTAGPLLLSKLSASARQPQPALQHAYQKQNVGISLLGGRAVSRATTLYSVDPFADRTMMQLCASSAKLRGGGPNLHSGI
ncbi:hypothetical protein GWG65_38035 [Bradyrhizobium sp. CSA207]|uniref:hypothetical protein n=1 Tax=Bradyrhizobium sp. CSA207 TaxID=2698826 RepID=UPI0023B111D3|nr:hypothetical protein [Bradyrhizobium sp. CSA207]MDE5447025.1 hypothetical protein [Bradyrhizobium sp. CSA207]